MFKKVVITTTLAGTLLLAPNVSEAALGDRTLYNGMSNSDVTELQNVLDDKGYFDYHKATGYFGSITEDGVRDFQRKAGISVDGIVGQQTVSALKGSNSSSSSHTYSSALRFGDRGQSVTNLQSELKSKGYYNYSVDGIYGSITVQAVRNFQSANGLSVDGIAGSNTFATLSGSSVSASSSSKVKSVSTSNSSVVSVAKQYIGVPYVWAGTSPSGFDCSGFLQYVFNKSGESIPRTVASIWNASDSVSSPSAGDIVFFETYKSGPSHAGIYIGNGQFIHCSSSYGVTISDMDNTYWAPRYLGAKRA